MRACATSSFNLDARAGGAGGEHPAPPATSLLVCGKATVPRAFRGQLGYGEVMRIISAVFALLGTLPTLPAVASSLDGATRLYALLLFVLICAVVALFASLSPSRRRAREIRRQVLQQQQQNQAMNQQVSNQQVSNQQMPPQQVQGAVSYPMHYQPKPAQPSSTEPRAGPGICNAPGAVPAPPADSGALASASSAGGGTVPTGANAGGQRRLIFGAEPFNRKPGATEHAPEHPGAA